MLKGKPSRRRLEELSQQEEARLERQVEQLYCTVLYCTVLYCTVLYYAVLYCTVLYCNVM